VEPEKVIFRVKLLSHAQANLERGETSFDVGCFQINYRWHGHAFVDLAEMTDPLSNARYAARFLGELFREFGDWTEAAGAYHSRTKVHADRYKKIFARHFSAPVPMPTKTTEIEPTKTTKQPRQNNFPLLRSGPDTTHMGSLVPTQGNQVQTRLGGLVN